MMVFDSVKDRRLNKMLELLQEVAGSELMGGFVGSRQFQIPVLLSGIALARKGALSAAAAVLSSVEDWGKPEIELVRRMVTPDRFLNMVAEDLHGSFGRPMCEGPAGLGWGAILGDRVVEVREFYSQAPEFITRVVGLRFNGRLGLCEGIAPGQPVYLLLEPLNPHDSQALSVVGANGSQLGYVKRSIAAQVAPRMRKGTAFAGHVEVLLGPQFDVNDRLNIKVKTV